MRNMAKNFVYVPKGSRSQSRESCAGSSLGTRLWLEKKLLALLLALLSLRQIPEKEGVSASTGSTW